LADDVGRGTPSPPSANVEMPRRLLVLAVSGWRRYSVRAELEAARRAGIPTTLISSDPELSALALELGHGVLPPEVIAGGLPEVLSWWQALIRRLRRVASALRRRARGEPVLRPRAHGRLAPEDLRDATLLVTDCQSMPLSRLLLESAPRLRLAFELDRSGPLAPAADSREADVESA
jgi:hypothetical protein